MKSPPRGEVWLVDLGLAAPVKFLKAGAFDVQSLVTVPLPGSFAASPPYQQSKLQKSKLAFALGLE